MYSKPHFRRRRRICLLEAEFPFASPSPSRFAVSLSTPLARPCFTSPPPRTAVVARHRCCVVVTSPVPLPPPRRFHRLVASPLLLLPGSQTLAATSLARPRFPLATTSRRCRHPPSHVTVPSPLPCAIAASPLFPPPPPCCLVAASRTVASWPCRCAFAIAAITVLPHRRLAVSLHDCLAMSSCRRPATAAMSSPAPGAVAPATIPLPPLLLPLWVPCCRRLPLLPGKNLGLQPPAPPPHHASLVGVCWNPSLARLAFLLASFMPSHVVIDHWPSNSTISLSRAPRQLMVWGLVDGEANMKAFSQSQYVLSSTLTNMPPFPISKEGVFLLLAEINFDVTAQSLRQVFPLSNSALSWGIDFGVIVFDIRSNWGADTTSLCTVHVYGHTVLQMH
jgi:hypothetical protein